MAIVTRYFSVGLPTSGSLSLAYSVTVNTIVRGSGSFVTDGFVNGDTISVQGTVSNNGVFTVSNVAALTLTVNEALANETVTSIVNKGDGSSWALRTNLFAGGAWSGRILLFDFSGSDSLKALVGPGTHTITAAFGAGFTSAPTAANLLFIHGCDSSGNPISPPDTAWLSNMPAFDDSAFPVIATTTNIAITTLVLCQWYCVKFIVSGRNGVAISGGHFSWVSIINSTSNASAVSVTGTSIANSQVSMTGSIYSAAIQVSTTPFENLLLIGVTGSSGNRYGFQHTGSTGQSFFDRITVRGFGGAGIINTGASAAHIMGLKRCTVVNNQGSGIVFPATASQTGVNTVEDCQITGNGLSGTGYGLDAQSQARVLLRHSRFRDNDDGDINGMLNYPIDIDNYVTDSDDTTEYVDAASGDFRIKNTAATWGMGFGVSDQAAAGGGGGGGSYGFSG